MKKEQVENKTKDIFRKLFPKTGEITYTTSSKEIRAWDSLKHVMLMNEIENEFNIKFDIDDMLGMSTFGDICRGIESKLNS